MPSSSADGRDRHARPDAARPPPRRGDLRRDAGSPPWRLRPSAEPAQLGILPARAPPAHTWRARSVARFGPHRRRHRAAITTASSNGSEPTTTTASSCLGGLAALSLDAAQRRVQRGSAGFLHMLLHYCRQVLGGLMVGRTPEYLGRKVEAKEVKLAMIALLLHPFVDLLWDAVRGDPAGDEDGGQPCAARVQRDPRVRRPPPPTARGSRPNDNNPPWEHCHGGRQFLGRYPCG